MKNHILVTNNTLFLNEGHGRGMDYTIAYFEVQESLVKVSGNRRYTTILEYSLEAGPKTSLTELQTSLKQQYIIESQNCFASKGL